MATTYRRDHGAGVWTNAHSVARPEPLGGLTGCVDTQADGGLAGVQDHPAGCPLRRNETDEVLTFAQSSVDPFLTV